jgi:hypothetical protein
VIGIVTNKDWRTQYSEIWAVISYSSGIDGHRLPSFVVELLHFCSEHGHNDDHKHATMTAPLTDVAVLVSRGMGMGAQQHLLGMGIQPVLTDLHGIDEAVEHYVAGTLVNNP